MSNELELLVYDKSITDREHRSLRLAADNAARAGEVTYLSFPGGRAAIVSEEAARWWEAYAAELCPACASGQHARCPRYTGQWCSCINAAVHNEHEMARAIQADLRTGR
jgi:hypothetical protein